MSLLRSKSYSFVRLSTNKFHKMRHFQIPLLFSGITFGIFCIKVISGKLLCANNIHYSLSSFRNTEVYTMSIRRSFLAHLCSRHTVQWPLLQRGGTVFLLIVHGLYVNKAAFHPAAVLVEDGGNNTALRLSLPREVVDSPSLEIFKTRLDAVLCSPLQVTLLWQGVGLDDPQRSLPTPNIL